jgi:hypothetical protein
LLLTGVTPYGSGDVEAVVARQLYEAAVPPSQRRPGLPAEVDAAVLQALRPEPHERFPSASAFAAALADGLARAPASTGETSRRIRVPGQEPATVDGGAATRGGAGGGADPGSMSSRRAPLHPSTRGSLRAPRAPGAPAQTRGALFRIACRLLGNHLGPDWLRAVADEWPAVAPLLSPRLSPISWHPVEHLVALLERASGQLRDPIGFSRAIGRATITATFARFFGADPRTLSPARLLRAAEAYWPRYHSWGRVTASQDDAASCALVLEDSPRARLLCAVVEGSFARIAELADARDVQTAHPECAADHPGERAAVCRFTVRWVEAGHVGSA